MKPTVVLARCSNAASAFAQTFRWEQGEARAFTRLHAFPYSTGAKSVTETAALTRALLDHCIMTGILDLGVWSDFKTAHVVEAQQIEPVLVSTIQHLCTMSRGLTEEVDRLSDALAWRH
jgi:hypothetical protein